MAIYLLLRNNAATQNSTSPNIAATVASIQNAGGINVQLSQIAAARDAAVSADTTARLNLLGNLIASNSAASAATIANTQNTQQNIALGAMQTGAQVTTSYIASDLAKSLATTQLAGLENSNLTQQNIAYNTNSTDQALAQINANTQQYIAGQQENAANTATKYKFYTGVSSDVKSVANKAIGSGVFSWL